MRLLGIGLSIMLFLASTGCTTGQVPPSLETYSLASRGVGISWAEGATLNSSVSDGKACFWIENQGQSASLVWPTGSTASGDPLTVTQPNTDQATTGKKVIELGGSEPSSTGCHPGSQRLEVNDIRTEQ